jgi:hypothetical protein
MHPELSEPVFAEWYGSKELQQAVCQLLGTEPEGLQLGTTKIKCYFIIMKRLNFFRII